MMRKFSSGLILCVWAFVAWFGFAGADIGLISATFVLTAWIASCLDARWLARFMTISSMFVVAGIALTFDANLTSILSLVLMFIAAVVTWVVGTKPTSGRVGRGSSGDRESEFEIASYDESDETRDFSGGELSDPALDSGLVGPELASQNSADVLSRASKSGAFSAAEIKSLETSLANAKSPLRAFKSLVASDELTKFQVMHLLWGQETQLRFGDYNLVEVIGRGSSSTVYRARHSHNGDAIAIKILHANEQAIKRVKREMESVRRLAHPNIVVAYDCGKIHSRFFIAMELISGSDLNRLVRRRGPLDERTALVSVLQIATALQQAHDRGILHRDVKPGNMLLTPSGDVKLADLGLSCPMDRQESSESFETAKNSLGGTLEFMAPEQAIGFRDVDARADTFALGSSLFFLLTGRSRLPGNNLAARINNLTVHKRFLPTSEFIANAKIAKLIDHLSAFEINDRVASAAEAVHLIRATIAHLGGEHQPSVIRVLLVEDNEDDMYMTLRMLAKTNRAIETVEAANLREAISRYEGNSPGLQSGRVSAIATDPPSYDGNGGGSSSIPFDIALLDANLPDSCGSETVERFRAIAPDLAVITLSGNSDEHFRAECLAAGSDSYLCKNDLTTGRLEREIFVTLARRRVAEETRQSATIFDKKQHTSSSHDLLASTD